MAKVTIDKNPPFELTRCRVCGGLARLHFSRTRRWYVRCEACARTPEKNQTEEVTSKLTVCKLWNVRNKENSNDGKA